MVQNVLLSNVRAVLIQSHDMLNTMNKCNFIEQNLNDEVLELWAAMY